MANSIFLPTIGGAQFAVHHLATQLTKMGQKIIVFAPREKSKTRFVANYKLEYYQTVPRGKKFLQGYLFALYLYLLQKKYHFDLIHIHKANMAYYAVKIKNMLKVPLVVTTHGGDIQTFPELNYGDRIDPVWNKRIEYAIRNADFLTAISSSTRKEYRDLGVDENKICDIFNGIDLGRFNEKWDDIRKKLKLPEDSIIILSVGRYHEIKGYEFLIKSIKKIVKENKKVRCLIFGDNLHKLKKMVGQLRLEDFVILMEQQTFDKTKNNNVIDLTKMPDSLLYSAYQSSDIYISASYLEGFSLVVVEAMAAGLPIIATNVPGNRDAVKDNINGFLVPAKDSDAIAENTLKLINNEQLRRKLGAGSKKTVSKYDWQIIASQYLDQYERIAKRGIGDPGSS